MPRPANRVLTVIIALFALACSGAPKTVPEPAELSLSGLAAQQIVVLPAYNARIVAGLDWGASVGRLSDVKKTLDADIVSALEERGVRKTWIFPDQLMASFRRNPTYVTDPYTLAEEPLRSPTLRLDERLPEPLASQIRTLVALHSEARYVLAPVDLRLEKAGTGGRGVLRVVLVDARMSNVRWIGEIPSDSAAT
ncbi:MAG TPA: hypothetical protein VIP11_20860, partial [Gemmatimonadaceae bacterium]